MRPSKVLFQYWNNAARTVECFGDEIGPNNPELANCLYEATTMLREYAKYYTDTPPETGGETNEV